MAEEKSDSVAVMPPAAPIMGDRTKDISVTQLITDGKNPRGIPSARFIENVDEFLAGTSVEAALGALNELYSKYKVLQYLDVLPVSSHNVVFDLFTVYGIEL